MNKLTVLGSGTSLSSFYRPLDYRHPSGHLLEIEKTDMLLDCSEGMRGRLNQIGFDYYKLDHIFITHFHPDHFDLQTFIQSFYTRAKKQKRNVLNIYGPNNIEKLFTESWNNQHKKIHYPNEFNDDLILKFVEYEDKKIYKINDTEVIPYKVTHTYMDSYALKIRVGNKIICYSGDCGECEGINQASENADIFLCESATNIGEDIVPGHLNSYQAGVIANKSRVKELILTHYTGKDSADNMIKEVENSGFKGKVEIATDFKKYSF